MLSTAVLFTAGISAFGLLLNSAMLALILTRGKKAYHYLFAGVLLICAIWDLGILLSMLRNNHPQELIIYGYIVVFPVTFLTALIYQFTISYLDKKHKIALVFWVISIVGFIAVITGWGGKIDDVYQYGWGNIYRPDRSFLTLSLLSIPFGWLSLIISSWMLFQSARSEPSQIKRRHMRYIGFSFIMMLFAYVKVLVLYGYESPVLLPAGMFVNDIFSAVIAVAIVKDHLFDITLIIKKGAVYSVLAGVLIFVFSFSEHLLITYVGDLIGGHSQWIHLISIAIGILVLMPIKHRVEGFVERYFADKQVNI
jgi:hypothetical protein